MTKILWCVLVSLFKYMRPFQRKDSLFFFFKYDLVLVLPSKKPHRRGVFWLSSVDCQLFCCWRELHSVKGEEVSKEGFWRVPLWSFPWNPWAKENAGERIRIEGIAVSRLVFTLPASSIN